ncbi:MAG: hypothetical protein NTV49_03350 [Kiritimatiellaeota bacterium]|nr:hypothetical protein [Kiritimatiellota bacterium]
MDAPMNNMLSPMTEKKAEQPAMNSAETTNMYLKNEGVPRRPSAAKASTGLGFMKFLLKMLPNKHDPGAPTRGEPFSVPPGCRRGLCITGMMTARLGLSSRLSFRVAADDSLRDAGCRPGRRRPGGCGAAALFGHTADLNAFGSISMSDAVQRAQDHHRQPGRALNPSHFSLACSHIRTAKTVRLAFQKSRTTSLHIAWKGCHQTKPAVRVHTGLSYHSGWHRFRGKVRWSG